MFYAEVVVDRPIIKRDRRSFVDAPEDVNIPVPEIEALEEGELNEASQNPLALTFHYHIPKHLVKKLKPGHMVAVPFRTEQLPAIVLRLSQTSPIEVTKPISALLDPEPVLTPAQLELAEWLSHEYLAPLAICIRYFLPPGSTRKPEWWLKVTPEAFERAEILDAQSQILLTYLRQHGEVALGQVDKKAAETLIEKGFAYREARLGKPRVGAKTDRTVELLIGPDQVEPILPTLGHDSKQANILLHLADSNDPLPLLEEVLTATGCATKSPSESLAKKSWVKIIPARTLVSLSATARRTKANLETPLSDVEQRIFAHLLQQQYPIPVTELLNELDINRVELYELVDRKIATLFEENTRISLTIDPNQIGEAVLRLRGVQKHADVLRLLAEEDGPVWIGWVYAQTQADLKTLKDLVEADLISIDEVRRWRDPMAAHSFALDTPPTMTPEQQAVWDVLLQHWRPSNEDKRPILLHGVTGSGKTEIYLRAMQAAMNNGQGSIFLVPEITLAAQTVKRVAARFPGKVAVWHSALSPGERYDTWELVRSGELSMVVGPRSALFAPVKNLGVIIVDEEHEPVYKQRDRTPIFHAREAAIELGRRSDSLVVLGSATPDIVTYRRAEREAYRLLEMPNRIMAHTKHVAVQQALLKRMKNKQPQFSQDDLAINQTNGSFVTLPLPKVEVVDLREELKSGNRTIFSRVLQDAIRETLRRGEQVILFLNRRGAASFVICRDCGYVVQCPRCETNMTYHTDGDLIVCHYCGNRIETPEQCPTCHNERIRYFGLGTQRVEDAVKTMFPQAQTIRWDWDTTRQRGSHDIFLQHFVDGKANVMIGTQMVAKGLDLPLVTLVGVISADTALHLPDFRAAERTFQLMMQVAGRAGRSPLGGRVIVQSYTPDQVPIEAASNHDYEGFYQMELAFRQEQRYPPFKRMALLLYSGPGYQRSSKAVETLARRLRSHVERLGIPAVTIIGPTPSYVQRVGSQYRWHILLRAADPAAILRPLLPLPHGWKVDIDPVTLL